MSESTVRKLHPEEEKAAEMPAVGVSLNIALGAGRALVIQTHVGQDDNIDGLLDKLLKASDRQKAKYEIVEIEDELRRMKLMQEDRAKQLENLKEAKETANYGAALEAIREEGDKLMHQHTASGRRGEFKFPNNYLQRLEAVKKETEARIKAAENGIRGAQIEFDRHTNEALRLQSEIEKRRKIVAGG